MSISGRPRWGGDISSLRLWDHFGAYLNFEVNGDVEQQGMSIVGVQRSRASAIYPEEVCDKYAALAMEHLKMMGHVEYLRKKLRYMETSCE